MHISKRGLALIESFEGFSSVIYNDGTGVMTVGYGTTSADVSPLPNHISRQEGENLLAEHLAAKYEPAVSSVNPANQNQFDALCSFAYNLGPGSMAWDVGRLTKAGDYRAAADAMLAYDHAGGQRLLGLTRRRWAEHDLYLTAPPPPPYNPHYEWFKTDHVHVGYGKRAISEKDTVMLYDRLAKHRWANWPRLYKVERDMAYLRNRIKFIAEHLDRKHGWTQNREWRYQQMRRRIHDNVKPAQR